MSEYIYKVDNGHVSITNEEIVRCSDCKHFTEHDEFRADIGIGFPLIMATVDTCDLWADTKCKVEPDGFCSWAVKRDD